MVKVVCETCRSEFKIKADVPNPVACRICQTPVDVPELRLRDEEIARKNALNPHCPGCGKMLAPGVKFCAACGTSTGDVWAAQAMAFEAKEKLKDRVWWVRIKNWFVRWF